MTGTLEGNSPGCLTPVDSAAFKPIKSEKPQGTLFCEPREDFKDYVMGADFDCPEYKNNPKKGKERLPSRRYFRIGMFNKHGRYLNINGADCRYRDISRNFGDISTIISNERTEELLKEITE